VIFPFLLALYAALLRAHTVPNSDEGTKTVANKEKNIFERNDFVQFDTLSYTFLLGSYCTRCKNSQKF